MSSFWFCVRRDLLGSQRLSFHWGPPFELDFRRSVVEVCMYLSLCTTTLTPRYVCTTHTQPSFRLVGRPLPACGEHTVTGFLAWGVCVPADVSDGLPSSVLFFVSFPAELHAEISPHRQAGFTVVLAAQLSLRGFRASRSVRF